MTIRRGDVHWVELPQRDPSGSEIEKARPCVIVSLTGVNEIRRTVVVVPLTHGARDAPPIVIPIARSARTARPSATRSSLSTSAGSARRPAR